MPSLSFGLIKITMARTRTILEIIKLKNKTERRNTKFGTVFNQSDHGIVGDNWDIPIGGLLIEPAKIVTAEIAKNKTTIFSIECHITQKIIVRAGFCRCFRKV